MKIIKIVATRSHIYGYSAPYSILDPTGGAHNTPPDTVAGSTLKRREEKRRGRKEWEGIGGREGKGGRGREGM